MKISHLRSIIAVIVLSLTGCSTYQNVTGYFNTFYNAKRLYADAIIEIEKAPQKDRDSNYFAAYNIPSSASDKLDKVIEKCSKLIQFYPKSTWIDDALLLIGKSYVYKGEGESALRKFNELFDNFPMSNLRFEAKLWYAKAQYQSKKESEALKTVKELISDLQTEKEDNFLLEAMMLEAQIFFDRSEYNQAVAVYGDAVKVTGDDNLQTIVHYQLGFCNERMGESMKAAEAYSMVKEYKPDFNKEFQSRLKQGRMLSLANQHDKALEIFNDLRNEQLKNDERGLVELETANTYKRMGDTAAAFSTYAIIDSNYKHTDASAKSYFQRGSIYEKEYKDFKVARSYYETAKSEFAASEVTPLAQKRFASLSNYFQCYDNLAKYDSLLFQASKPSNDSGQQKSIVSVTDSSQKFSDTTNTGNDSLKVNNIKAPEQKTDTLTQSVTKTAALPDSLLSVRSRLDSITQRAVRVNDKNDTLFAVRDSVKNQKKISPSIAVVKFSPDSLRSLINQTEFELAGLLYLEMNLPDSALFWYEEVARDNPSSTIIPRVLYAIAEIHRTQNDTSSIDSLYNIILSRYDTSEYATQVKKLRGIEIISTVVEPAEQLYKNAEELLLSGNSSGALKCLDTIQLNYPLSKYAPKALYTMGWIFETVLVKNDSAAFWYKKLIKEYPTTTYAGDAKPKVAVKDDPKSLSQYIKINEIPLLGKAVASQQPRKGTGDTGYQEKPDEELQKGKNPDEDNQDNQDDEEEAPTDDGGGD